MRFLKMLISYRVLQCFVKVRFLEQARFRIDFLTAVLLIFGTKNIQKSSKSVAETTLFLKHFLDNLGDHFGPLFRTVLGAKIEKNS